MTPPNDQPERVEVVCPHCRKPFVAELLARPSARHRGYKCPHCKLFVPHDRVKEPTVPPRSPSLAARRDSR